jgi:hypothetical protein
MSERDPIIAALARLLEVGLKQLTLVPQRDLHTPIEGQRNVFRPTRVIDAPGVTRILAASWPSMQEFEALTELLQRSRFAKTLYTTRSGSDRPELEWAFAVGSYVANLFSDYVRIGGEAKFDYGRFSALANQWLDSIEADRRRVELWAPLFSFDMPDYKNPVSFPLDIVLLKPSQDQLATLADPFVIGGEFPSPPHGDFPEFFLSASADSTVAQPFNTLKENLFADVALAIRLAEGGDANVRQVGTLPRPGDCRPYVAGYFQDLARTSPRGLHRSQMSIKNVERVEEVLQRLPDARGEWPTALRRYGQIPLRVSMEDRLVDAVIALESILSPDKAEEISYRFRLRGAWLFGAEDREARKTWSDRLARAYDMRSVIVHGSSKELKKLSEETILEILGYMDEALRQVLSDITVNSRGRDQWRQHLEAIVLG